jgi:hypothetical protein
VDVATWLRQLGLERYEGAFRDAEITPDVLCDLGEANLEKLDLPLGPRKKLMRAIGELRDTPTSAPPLLSKRPIGTARQSEAERRQLTVIFIDLVGSTELSQLEPEDMREVIRGLSECGRRRWRPGRGSLIPSAISPRCCCIVVPGPTSFVPRNC